MAFFSRIILSAHRQQLNNYEATYVPTTKKLSRFDVSRLLTKTYKHRKDLTGSTAVVVFLQYSRRFVKQMT